MAVEAVVAAEAVAAEAVVAAAAVAVEAVVVAVAEVGWRRRWGGGGGFRFTRPIALAYPTQYHMFPSGPAVIPKG